MSEKIAIKYNEKNICRLPVIPSIGKKVDIIAGINYIDAEYWNEAKKHKGIIQKLEKGILQEVKVKVIKKEVDVEETKKEVDKDGKEISKKVKVKKEQNIKITKFNELDNKEKEEIIKETFNIKSLEEFKDKEQDAEIRYMIEKKIDTIKNAKTDETIGYPKNHLKV